jgi:hypothetical protein
MESPPPFNASQVTCHALHPDGRTLFVSAGRLLTPSPSRVTAAQAPSPWIRSLWLLPFTGQAYFDAELEAWVGLCGNRQRRSWVPVLLGRRACSAAEFTDPPS